jgi:hypothetical protein
VSTRQRAAAADQAIVSMISIERDDVHCTARDGVLFRRALV